jgi:hypothetical protein
VAFSPDGQRILTTSFGIGTKVWARATTQQVAAWQEEERMAAQSLATEQQKWVAGQERQRIARARDEGAIRRWLILAPIILATNQTEPQGLDIQQVEGEGQLRPKAGDATSIDGRELKWQAVTSESDDYVIDFDAVLGEVSDHSVAYAVCYIRAESEQHGLQMLVGSDDEAKVYLNGIELFKSVVGRRLVVDQDTVEDVTLKAGLNLLVFKVVNEVGPWKGSIRFQDTQGNPLKGIKVTLSPDEKD